MKGKRLIDPSITGGSGEPARAYYGSTLTSLIGDTMPVKELLRSLECTRVTPGRSTQTNRISFARRHLAVSSYSACSNRVPSLWSNREVPSVRLGASSLSDLPTIVTPGTSASRRSISTACSQGTGTASAATLPRGRRGAYHRQSKTLSEIPETVNCSVSSIMDIGDCPPGLAVWRLENRCLHQISRTQHGVFHEGDCYIIQNRNEDSVFLHIWSGSLSHKLDRESVRVLADKLDRSYSGSSVMTIEFQGYETPSFMRHFQDGVIIVEGKYKQRVGKAVRYNKRLYKVNERQYTSATCIECLAKAATANSVLILDGYPRIYVWVGQLTDFATRVHAVKLAKMMRTSQRNGRGHIIVVDHSNQKMSDAFLKKLGCTDECDQDVYSEEADNNETNYQPKLYKASGERVLYDMPLVATQPLHQKYLTTKDAFILDMGPFHPLYIWVGRDTDPEVLYDAVHFAENFIQHHNYPHSTPICRVMEGSELNSFRKVFIDWKGKDLKGRQLIKNYNISNIEKVLFSKSANHTVAKLTETVAEDWFLTGDGVTEVWQVKGGILECLSQQHAQEFSNGQCYIVLYREVQSGENCYFIYFWEGRGASKESQDHALRLAFSINSILEYKATVIRVLDGKEPQHFLTVLQKRICVYDADLIKEDALIDSSDRICHFLNFLTASVNMFCVRELASECIRVSQVPPSSSSLNSSAVFVVISDQFIILWFGKIAGAYEREYSKKLVAYFCPERSHDYDIVTEGNEPANFWSLVAQTGVHQKQFSVSKLQRQSANLKLCSRRCEKWFFNDIPDLSQENLYETDTFILDTHDQIIVWTGTSVMDRNYKLLSQAAETYIKTDPTGRNKNDIQIMYCSQGYEPSSFTKHFMEWSPYGYGGEHAFEAARKQLRQENALIDIENVDIVSEQHLLQADFTNVTHLTKDQFYKLPNWKQHQILKSAG